MPRVLKDSDDDTETKIGRRTRGIAAPSVTNSPLRRSSRIRRPVHQDGSSPESLNEANIGPNTKRRIGIMEPGAAEQTRTLRSRKNSVSSDVSEISDLQTNADTPKKRLTRRSITAQLPDTPESTARARRSLRAGSESKSTPPVVKARRTRASSVESEPTIDTLLKKGADSQSTTVPINTKTRRRASVLPSEPVLAEEAEEVKSAIPEVSDSVTLENDESHNLSSSSIKKTSKTMSANTSLEVVNEEVLIEESPAKDSVIDSSEKSLSQRDEASPSDVSTVDTKSATPKKSEHATSIETVIEIQSLTESLVNNKTTSPSPQKRLSLTLKETSKELGLKIESLLNKSTEKQEMSPGNKENEKGNIVVDTKSERNIETVITNVILTGRKSLGSLLEATSKEKHNLSVDDRLLSNISDTKNMREETITVHQSFDNSEEPDSVKTKILSRRRSLKNKVTEEETSNSSSQKNESYSEPMEVDEIIVENLNEVSNDKITFQGQGDVVLKEAFVKLDKIELNSERTNKKDEAGDPVKLQQNLNEESEAKVLEMDVSPEDQTATSSEPSLATVKSNTVSQPSEKFLTNLESKTPPCRKTFGKDVQEHSTGSPRKRLSLNISNLKSDSPTNNSELMVNIQENDAETAKDENMEKESSKKNAIAELNEYVTDCSMSDTISIRNVSLDPNEKSSVIESPTWMVESSNGDELSCTIKNTKSSIVPDLTSGLTQGESADQVEPSVTTTSNSPSKTTEKSAKSQSVTSPEVDNKKSQRTQGRVNVNDSDIESNVGDLFQDIPADEWEKVKDKKLVECESSSMHSVSTERLENESEVECDLILVDREAWQAAEAEKLVRKNQNFDYDSDDTIIMKTRKLESEVKKDEKQTQLEVLMEEEAMEVVSDDEVNKSTGKHSSAKKQLNEGTETLNSSKRKSLGRRKSSTNTENDDVDGTTVVNDDTNTLNLSARKSLSNRKSPNKTPDSSCVVNTLNRTGKTPIAKNKGTVIEDDNDSDDELNMNSSQGESSMIRKSFNNLQDSLDISRKSLNKSNKSVNLNLSENSKDNLENDSTDTSTRKSINRKSINKTIELNSVSSSDDEQFVLEEVKNDESYKANTSSRKSLSNRKSLNVSHERKSTSRIEKQESDERESSNNLSNESSGASKYLNKSRERKSAILADEKADEQKTSCNSSCNINVSSRKSADLRRSLNKSFDAKSFLSSKDEDQDYQIGGSAPDNVNSSSRKSTGKRKSLNTSQQNSSQKVVAEEAVTMMDTGSDNEAGKEVEEMEQSNMQDSTAEMKPRNSSKKVSVVKKIKPHTAFNDEESSDDDFSAKFSEDDSSDNIDKSKSKNSSLKIISDKKPSFKKNYSTLAHYGSDHKSGSSSDEFDDNIPSFLFNANTSEDEDGTESSIDSDVARDMNLNGDTSLKYSDDDVPADDCRDSESESSDSDDNGSDLADFVVDDDEIVEDEEDMEDMEEEADNDYVNEEEDIEESDNKKKKKKYNRITLQVDSEDEEDNTESEDVDKEKEEDSDAEMEQVSNSPLSTGQNISKSSNKNKTLDEPEEIIESKSDLEQSRKSLTKKQQKLISSIECSTPISISTKEKSNEKRSNQFNQDDSLLEIVATEVGLARKKSLSAQTLTDVKTPTKAESNSKEKNMPSFKTQKALQQSLPIDPPDITETTNLSRKKSLKINKLNKSMATPNSESPLTKYLKKQKLNESLPLDVGDEELRKLKRKSMIQQRKSMGAVEDKVSNEEDNRESNAEEAMDEAEDVLDTDPEKQKGSQARKIVTVEKDEEIQEEIVTEKRIDRKKNKRLLRKERKKLAKELSRTSSLEQTEKDESFEPKKTCNEKQNVETVNSTTNEDSLSTKSSEVVAEGNVEKKKKSKKKKQKSEMNQEIEQEKSQSNKALENIKTRESDEGENVASLQKSNKKQKKNKKKNNKSLTEGSSTNENEQPSEESLVNNSKKEKKRKLKEATESAQSKVAAKKNPKSDLRTEKMVVEEPTSKKRAKKQRQVEKSEEIEIQKKVPKNKFQKRNVDSSSDVNDAPESLGFAEARDAAVLEMKNTAVSIKAGKESKKKNNMKHNKKVEQDKQMKVKEVIPTRQSVKRLPDDVIENISDVPTRPKKRRKLAKKEEKIFPSRSMFSPNKPSNCHIETQEAFIPLSSSGGTTQFEVASLEKIKKNQKKVTAALFRERMLCRNRRQQVSAYLMYHQKQKAAGKDKFPKPM